MVSEAVGMEGLKQRRLSDAEKSPVAANLPSQP